MKKVYDVYTEAIRDHFKVFYANWPIGEPVKLGDYGIMNGRIFIREGNIIDDYDIKFKSRIDTTQDHYHFKSTDSVEVEYSPNVSSKQPGMPCIRASIKFDFASKESVFFNAAGIKNHSIENSAKVGEKIFSMFKKRKWSVNSFIVTRLVQADSTTIIISGKSGASISLDAESETIPYINLANASIRIFTKVEKGVAFKIITGEGYFPMIGISGIKPRNWILPGSKDIWRSLSKTVYLNMFHLMKLIEKGKTTYEEEFYFGEI